MNIVAFLLLLSAGVIYKHLGAAEAASCYLHTQAVTPQLLYVHTANTSGACSSGFAGEESVGQRASSSIADGLVVEVAAAAPPEGYSAYVVTFTAVEQSPGTAVTEWFLQGYSCWLSLAALTGFDTHVHELDVDDHLKLEVQSQVVSPDDQLAGVILRLPEHFWDISVALDDVSLFDVYTTETDHLTRRTLSLDMWQRASLTAVSVVTFQLVHCPTNCSQCSLTVQISSQCPVSKHLKFVYPGGTNNSKYYKLPVNYRPPSWLGTAIPTSPHVYHTDPSKPLRNSLYTISKKAVEFNQCAGQSVRSECNCSEAMRTSTDISVSDCIEQAYFHLFEEPFSFNLLLQLSNSSERAVELPVQLQEINNRSDFSLKGEVDDEVITPNGRKVLIFHGPGLYHFQASVTGSASFCQLSAQFTVYVVSAPLQKSGEFSITTATTILFGVLTFTAYIIYHHFPPTHQHHHI